MNVEKANRVSERVARETGDSLKVVIDHGVALQERNVRFAQDIVDGSIKGLRSQAESNRALTHEIVERAEKQREAFQTLAEESLNSYMDFLYAPFSYYKEGLRLVEDVNNSVGSVPNYDELSIGDISAKFDALTAEQLREIKAYEKRNKNRETLIEQLDRKLKPAAS